MFSVPVPQDASRRCKELLLGEFGFELADPLDLDRSEPLRNGISKSSIEFWLLEYTALSAPPLLKLLFPMRETNRFDPGMIEKEDFFLDAFSPTELDALPTVPVDKSSAVGVEVVLVGEEDNDGEFSPFLFFRNFFKPPSHRFRVGVPTGADGAAVITIASELSANLMGK